jgi:hypothetical protein
MTCYRPLRRVFYRLKTAVGERFPDDPNVRYTAISAFLFLRLFCPAIINPKLFNMMAGASELLLPPWLPQPGACRPLATYRTRVQTTPPTPWRAT